MFKWRRSPDDETRPLAAAIDRPADAAATTATTGPQPSTADQDQPGASASAEDRALDAFVAVLRAFGQHAFDLEHESAISFSQQCEAWARHLTILTPPPSDDLASETDGADGADATYAGPRDWPTVQHFLLARRKREQEHVNKALGDLRQGIWAFAQSLGTALIEDQRMDNKMKSQIDRLKVALEGRSTEQLKNEVVSAANSLSRLVTERQGIQRRRMEELGQRVTDLAGQLREAKQENVRDALTQLVNRKGFDEFMNRMMFMRDVFAETATLLMVDVDRFKSVNDTYGHPGGDAVLKAIADCLVRNFPRKSDLVARYGGEEFAVVLPDTSAQNAKRLAERMRQSIKELKIPYADKVIGVTVSVGVGQCGRHESVQSWLERTDQALYLAKARGRDQVVEAIEAD